MSSESSRPMVHLSEALKVATELPNGARYYRCALQVNPFDYLKTQNKSSSFSTEESYNKALINACLANKIEVIAVTDHYRVRDSTTLVTSARKEGIFAFLGCEAVSKDGVHFLCLFDYEKDKNLERFIGACGVQDSEHASPTGTLDATELLECANKWGAVCIAAHATIGGGLLAKLTGQSRVNVWTHSDLLACAIPGPVAKESDAFKRILENKDPHYTRNRPIAVLNAGDVTDPADLNDASTSCYVKMSDVTVEGFRQAFLDPESRVRLHSDEEPERHAEILSMSFEGGFLRDTAVHFNKNLNVLIGGRGTGKSTLIESIRYVLDLEPLGEEARKTHESVVSHVLRTGTKISLLIRTPAGSRYTIERTVPNPPLVCDEEGQVLDLLPSQVFPDVELYGQHEISELSKSPEKLTRLLERFVKRSPDLTERKTSIRTLLERSRHRIVEIKGEMQRLDERLAGLPGLEEYLKRFQQTELEVKLKEKSLLIREEQLLTELWDRLDEYRNLCVVLSEALPIDRTFISPKALEDLPNADVFSKADPILQTLSTKLRSLADEFQSALSDSGHLLDELKASWDKRKSAVEDTYEQLLRELQKDGIDGAEFIQIRKQVDSLRPLNDKMLTHRSDLGKFENERCSLLEDWETIKAEEYLAVEVAARKVTEVLRGRVRVSVTMAGNREPLENLIREVGGNLSSALSRLRGREQLTPREFAQRCREGADALETHFNLTAATAERIARADPELIMKIEELELEATTELELNTAPEEQEPNWQTLKALSAGQKATAVLLLLLLESEAPLVVDQPEDDLDNRFIMDALVPMVRQEKQHRQFLFSTHNANIPVLGDAELILGLSTIGVANVGQSRIEAKHMGSIDSKPLRELVENILEGGKAAFEMRRSKYGF